MRKIGTWYVAVGLIGLVTATGALAQHGDTATAQPAGTREGGHPIGRGFGAQGWMQDMAVARIVNDAKAASEIGLSAEQLKTLKDAIEQLKTQRDQIQKQLTELATQQGTLMEAATIDETAVMAIVDKVSAARLELDKARIKALLVFKKTLTPEQSEKIKAIVEEQRRTHSGDLRHAPAGTPTETPPAPAAK